MTAPTGNIALVALHYQNEVLHPDGKIRVGLQADSPIRQQVIQSAKTLFGLARERRLPIVHVRIGFRPDFADLIANAPIFRNVAAMGACIEGSWGTQYYEELQPQAGSPHEYAIKHTRVNGFYGSQLEEILRITGANRLLISGVATHSVVESTVRHAVDMGYHVMVAADACAAAHPDTHAASLKSMSLIADILDDDALQRLFANLPSNSTA